MKSLEVILADDEYIEIQQFGLPLYIVLNCQTKEEAISIWKKMTPDQLEKITITENGEKIVSFGNVVLNSVQFVQNGDDTITAHFHMDGEHIPNSSDEYVMAAKILLGEDEG